MLFKETDDQRFNSVPHCTKCLFAALEKRRIEESSIFPIAKGEYLTQYAEKIKDGLIPYELKV